MLPIVLALLVGSTPSAADSGIPPAVQAAVIRKLIQYDRTLAPLKLEQVTTLVVYSERSNEAEALVGAMRAVGLSATAVSLDSLAKTPKRAHLVVVSTEPEADAIRTIVAGTRTLTVANNGALVREGKAAIGYGPGASGKLTIFVHAARLRIEQHELAAGLLEVAEVIK